MTNPTKEQILAKLYIPSKGEREIIASWKRWHYTALATNMKIIGGTCWTQHNGWNNKNYAMKLVAIQDLIETLSKHYRVKAPKFEQGAVWGYDEDSKTIISDVKNVSIISALHELGHHLFGRSELQASRFAIGIFATSFPKSYGNLKWRGSRLVKS